MTYRLSFTFSIFVAASAAGDGPWNPDTTSGKQPNTTMIPSTIPRFISCSFQCADSLTFPSSPSSQRRDGAKREPDRAKPQLVVSSAETVRQSDHPVCAASPLAFGASTPLRGGEYRFTVPVCPSLRTPAGSIFRFLWCEYSPSSLPSRWFWDPIAPVSNPRSSASAPLHECCVFQK